MGAEALPIPINNYKVPRSECPRCYSQMGPNMFDFGKIAKAPAPGGVTFCLRCGEVCFFDDILQLRSIDSDDEDRLGREVIHTLRSQVKWIRGWMQRGVIPVIQ